MKKYKGTIEELEARLHFYLGQPNFKYKKQKKVLKRLLVRDKEIPHAHLASRLSV